MAASGNGWSYVLRDEEGEMKTLREKVEISDEATVGVYGFASFSIFEQGYLSAVSANDRTNGEFYVGPIYNHLVNQGNRVFLQHVGQQGENFFGLGVPKDFEFAKSSNIFRTLTQTL